MQTTNELAYQSLAALKTRFEEAANFLASLPLRQRMNNGQDIADLRALAADAGSMTSHLEHEHMPQAHQGLAALRGTVAARVAFFAEASKSVANCNRERGATQLLEFYTDVNQTLAKVALR